MPPTSPSVETPPVVIVGSSSSTGRVDVTFGFELNEQLLALSVQPSPPSQQPKATAAPAASAGLFHHPPESSMMTVSFSPEPTNPPTGFFSSPSPSSASSSSPDETMATTPPSSVDFASRYRERPELLNPPLSRRSYEIVDFISQGTPRPFIFPWFSYSNECRFCCIFSLEAYRTEAG